MDVVDEAEGWSNAGGGKMVIAIGVDHAAEFAIEDVNTRVMSYATEVEGSPARVVEFLKDGNGGQEVMACRVWFKLDLSRRFPVPLKRPEAMKMDIDVEAWGLSSSSSLPGPSSSMKDGSAMSSSNL